MTAASSVLVDRGVTIPMSDGCRLMADIWRLADGAPHPALLLRTPYSRSDVLGAMYFSGVSPLDAVNAGFTVVLQDVRGRFDSEGTFRAFVDEEQDGGDTISWIRSQRWCNGSVATYGASYFGLTALCAAQAGRADAVAALFTSADPRDGWLYTGGAFELGLALLWCAEAFGRPELARRRSGRGGAAISAAEEAVMVDLLHEVGAAYQVLPLAATPAGDVMDDLRDWLRHPLPDDYWRERSPLAAVQKFGARVLHVAGWFDLFLSAGLRDYQAFRDQAATPEARSGQRLVIGPWAHAVPHDGVGECYFGPEAAQTQIALGTRILDFLARPPAPDEPRVLAFVMNENRWRELADWPPPAAGSLELFLTGTGPANSVSGAGILSLSAAGNDMPPDSFTFDPLNPVPTAGGAVFLPGVHANVAPGPRSQHLIEGRADVLVYTSAPLAADLTCLGSVRMTLWAASSAPDTDWTGKLVDVAPDGTTLSVTDGILRCRYRHGGDRAWLKPDRPEEFVIDMAATGWRFGRGHRIRLQVSSSNFPRFDRNPNSRVKPWLATNHDMRPARQTVLHDAARPSRLVLSVAPDSGLTSLPELREIFTRSG